MKQQAFKRGLSLLLAVILLLTLTPRVSLPVTAEDIYPVSMEMQDLEILEGTRGGWTSFYEGDVFQEFCYTYYPFDILADEAVFTFSDGSERSLTLDELYEYFYYQIDEPFAPGNTTEVSLYPTYEGPDAESIGSFRISILPNPLERFEVAELELWEGIGTYASYYSYYDDDGNYIEGMYYPYDYYDRVQITLYTTDGASWTVEGMEHAIMSLVDRGYLAASDGDDPYAEWWENDVVQTRDDQEDLHAAWGLGSHTAYAGILGKVQPFTVSILESPIDRVEVDDVSLYENVSGYTDYAYNEQTDTWDIGWFHYSYYDQLRIHVFMKDGSSYNVGYDFDLQELGLPLDQWVCAQYRDDQSPETPWGLGEHTADIHLLGHTVPITVTVLENPIDHVELYNDQLTLLEGLDGWYTEDYDEEQDAWVEWYHYSYDSKLQMRLVLKDGSSYDLRPYSNLQDLGLPMDVFVDVWQEDDQSFATPWGAGTHSAFINVLGQRLALTVNVEHNWDKAGYETAPSCTEAGVRLDCCAFCGETRTVPVPALGHDFRGGACVRCGLEIKASDLFVDVQDSDYFAKAVVWAIEKGITKGTDATHFAPGAVCSREQVVTFLWAAYRKLPPASMVNPFTDVPDNAWYLKPVLWAKEKKITSGVGGGLFGVGQSCTRAQVVTFLWAAADKPEPKTTVNPFTDVSENDYFYKSVLWAVENGITKGKSATSFGPGDICTRAQVVTFLYAAMGKNPPAYEGYVSELVDGSYVRADDDIIYQANFSDYLALMEQARGAEGNDQRYLLLAQAEAALLDSAVVLPFMLRERNYMMSSMAPYTTPYALTGHNKYRLHGAVLSDELLTRTEREELTNQWKRAVAGEGSYDPAAYLRSKGHSLKTSYTETAYDNLYTLDWMSTSDSFSLGILSNCVEGLVEYDNLGNLQPALAESWEISADGKTYTFHLRDGVKWYQADGSAYADLTAGDFVAGFHHALDTQTGLEFLAGSGNAWIAGVDAYIEGDGSFDDVGCKAPDDHTLVFTLEQPVPYFMSLLTYNVFLPICESFYLSKGGVFGRDAYLIAVLSNNIQFGLADDLSSQLYCGPYLLRELETDSVILCVKNPSYYKAGQVTLDSLKWVSDYDLSDNAVYNGAVSGEYVSVTLSQYGSLLDRAKADGNFDKYAYLSDAGTTTYFCGLNLNRGAFALEDGAVASEKTEQQKADTVTAMNNKNFRKALLHAFDKTSYNAVSAGEDLAEGTIRNMITHPELVKLENTISDAEGHSFQRGSFYGELVQYYCDQLGCQINCADGVDGWYNPAAARDYLQAAVQEMGDSVGWPIQIDVPCYMGSDTMVRQVNAYKASIENALGSNNVVINIVNVYNNFDYYNSTYFADGESSNFDMYAGNGWGPDYNDPATYLNAFDNRIDGYLLQIFGLY